MLRGVNRGGMARSLVPTGRMATWQDEYITEFADERVRFLHVVVPKALVTKRESENGTKNTREKRHLWLCIYSLRKSIFPGSRLHLYL